MITLNTDDLSSILNKYYNLTKSKKKELLGKIQYDSILLNKIIEITCICNLNIESYEILKILLGNFDITFLVDIMDVISDEFRPLQQRLFFIEAVPFLEKIEKSKLLDALNNIMNRIKNNHILMFMQETIECIKI